MYMYILHICKLYIYIYVCTYMYTCVFGRVFFFVLLDIAGFRRTTLLVLVF